MLNTRKIKGRMIELGLTQKDIADTLGIAQATTSQKLNGKRPLYLDEAKQLAEILCIDTGTFGTYFFTSCLRNAKSDNKPNRKEPSP